MRKDDPFDRAIFTTNPKRMFQVNTVLHDQMTDDMKPELKVRVSFENGQIWINAEGHGEYCAPDGEGCPIGIEYADGKLRVVVWPDINVEDPTIIEMDGALEKNRVD